MVEVLFRAFDRVQIFVKPTEIESRWLRIQKEQMESRWLRIQKEQIEWHRRKIREINKAIKDYLKSKEKGAN